MEADYSELGLRVGFEIHQELDTHKLFCRCPSGLSEAEPKFTVVRRLRPSQSEMGEVDRAAISEAMKGKSFMYQVTDNSCLVELDCEPPHHVNEEALDICLQIALMLRAEPVDEIHVMRKIVIDGSNPSGFQRTMLVATNGHAEVDGKRFSIPTICLEEDAARKVGEDDAFIHYRLDRLGIPLVEIATGPDFNDPETPARAALYIGRVLRATGRVRRGIGTIRQDINISISKGARQEIKGVQELALIPEVIRREVQRQLRLLEIAGELKKRGAGPSKAEVTDVSGVFSGTRCNLIRRALERGEGVFAVILRGFAGLVGMELQPGRRFGTELADRAKTYGRVGGIFHTDELPAYGISQEEVSRLRAVLKAGENDAVVFVAGPSENAEAALRAVVERANLAIEGVPEETRRALPDGNTEFMRPLPGAGRMYPETDIPPIPVSRERLRRVRRSLPEMPEKRVARLVREHGLSRELADRIAFSDNFPLFERLVRKTGASPTLIAATLEETMVSLKREGVDVEKVEEGHLERILKMVGEGRIVKDALPEIIREIAQGMSPEESVGRLGILPLSRDELEAVVKEVVALHEDLIREKGTGAIMPLMGVLMERLRGRADGRLVREVLGREIEKRLRA
jgi:glutamyl-tRNA(Gln) amidotransferase subunit E